MKKIFFLFLTTILSLSAGLNAGYGKVYIDIHSPSATRFPILIPDFKNLKHQPDKKRLAQKMPEVIAEDLKFSGLFKILDPDAVDNSFLKGLTSDKISWGVLSIIGAEAVVTGGFVVERHNKLTVELRIFDAVQGRFITGKKYEGEAEDYRLITHRFSNEIFNKLTGEKGMFDTKIAYVLNKAAGKKDICVIDYDGHNHRQITQYGSLTLSPSWSPDGNKIAFTSYKDGNPDLYVKDIYSGKVDKISSKQGINISPSWSPDGKKIALTLSLNNGNSEVYSISLKSKRLERMTHDWATDVSPSWSPDGKKIAFVSSRAGTPQIYSLNTKTGKIKRLTFEGNYNTSPDWAPGGDKIVYSGLISGKYNLHIITPDGQFHQQLTYGEGNNEDPSWSPDGRFLTFSSDRTGQKEIYIMRGDGTGQKKITHGKGNKTNPDWAP